MRVGFDFALAAPPGKYKRVQNTQLHSRSENQDDDESSSRFAFATHVSRLKRMYPCPRLQCYYSKMQKIATNPKTSWRSRRVALTCAGPVAHLTMIGKDKNKHILVYYPSDNSWHMVFFVVGIIIAITICTAAVLKNLTSSYCSI